MKKTIVASASLIALATFISAAPAQAALPTPATPAISAAAAAIKAGAAAAKSPTPAPAPDLTLTATQTSARESDPLCEQARASAREAGACAAEVETATEAATVVNASEIDPSDLGLTSSDGVTLSAAASAGKIYSKKWSQTKRGLYYVNWVEKHSGRFYYNGSRVWSTSKTYGLKGTHVCNQGYAIGYSVVVTNCSTDALSSAKLQEWDYFQVHVIVKGFPIYFSHNIHATMTKSGSMS
jgi:hypothetical protein